RGPWIESVAAHQRRPSELDASLVVDPHLGLPQGRAGVPHAPRRVPLARHAHGRAPAPPSRPSIVGTREVKAEPRWASTAAASNLGWIVTGAPSRTPRSSTIRPPTCASGRQQSQRSPSEAPSADAEAATAASIVRRSNWTNLG